MTFVETNAQLEEMIADASREICQRIRSCLENDHHLGSIHDGTLEQLHSLITDSARLIAQQFQRQQTSTVPWKRTYQPEQQFPSCCDPAKFNITWKTEPTPGWYLKSSPSSPPMLFCPFCPNPLPEAISSDLVADLRDLPISVRTLLFQRAKSMVEEYEEENYPDDMSYAERTNYANHLRGYKLLARILKTAKAR